MRTVETPLPRDCWIEPTPPGAPFREGAPDRL